MVSAAGVVIYRVEEGRRLYLLLRNRKRTEWGLPKGHLEPGESDREGALRELVEETGIEDAVLDPGFLHAIEYRAKGKPKRVAYFLGRVEKSEVALSKEHDDYEWRPFEEALAQLPHENLRGVIRAVEGRGGGGGSVSSRPPHHFA